MYTMDSKFSLCYPRGTMYIVIYFISSDICSKTNNVPMIDNDNDSDNDDNDDNDDN